MKRLVIIACSIAMATPAAWLGFESEANATSCPTGFSLVAGTSNVCERRFTSGTTTWSVPSGVTSIDILVVGGGGGGGGSRDLTNYSGGGGGGGGGIVATSGLAVTGDQLFTVTVGAGGAAGARDTNGHAGQSTSVTRSPAGVTLTANGGGGGGKGSTGRGDGGLRGSASCTGCATSISPEGGSGGDGELNDGKNGSNGVTITGSSDSKYGILREGTTSIAVAGGGGGGSRFTSTTGGSGGGGAGGGVADPVAGAANMGGGGGGADSSLSSRASEGGAAGGSGVVIIRTLASNPPAPTPTFDTPVRTAGGFTVNVTNYDAAYTWTPTVGAGSVTAGTASGATLPLTVTGLAAGASATITMATTRTGYTSGSATVTGQAKSTQTVTWAPTAAISTTQSPHTPSTLASALGAAPITYSVVAGFTTTTCTVVSATAVLTYTGTGTCTVRATAATTVDYLEGTKDVTFTVSKAAQTVTWSPTTAVTTVQSPLTPSTSASALGSAPITYGKVSNTTTSCTVNETTGQLTYAGTGNCVARASAAATDLYAAGSTDVTFVVSKATPSISWAPTLSLEVPSGSTTFSAATTSSDGAITYAVTNAGATGCSLSSPTSRLLSFTAAGSCEVTANVAASDTYDAVTSVKTFAISKAAQTVTWAPSTTLTLANLSTTLATATTSGDGTITYSVTSAGGTGCNFATASSSVLSYTAAGTCSVTATAAETTGYAQGTRSATITISLATPTLSWAPTTALSMPAATLTPSPAPTNSGDGAFSYAVTSDTGAGCAVNATTGALSYTATGQCQVTATSAATTRYQSGATAVTFTISLASQSITAAASPTSLAPGATSALSRSGSSGTGAVTWALTSGAGVCTLSGTTVRAVVDGSCVLTVTIAADSVYGSASSSVTITVVTPGGGGGGGSGSGGGGGDSGGGSSTPSATTDSTPTPGRTGDDIKPPGESETVLGKALPPPPLQVLINPLEPTRSGQRKSAVFVSLPKDSAGATVLATVVLVKDAKGRVVSRLNVRVQPGQTQIEVTAPFVATGYSVNVYNVNEVGVSTGALSTSPLVFAPTITKRERNGTPRLFGQPLTRAVKFKPGAVRMGNAQKRQLNEVAARANESEARLFITGFTQASSQGPKQAKAASTARAKAVANYLSNKGVRVWIRYWGAGAVAGGNKANRVEIRSSTEAIPRVLVG